MILNFAQNLYEKAFRCNDLRRSKTNIPKVKKKNVKEKEVEKVKKEENEEVEVDKKKKEIYKIANEE